MHPRWVAVLGGLGVLDVAYLDLVIAPRWLAAEALPAQSAESTPPAASAVRVVPAAAVPATAAVARAGRGPRAPEPEAQSEPPAAAAVALRSAEPAAAHERPPGETWWIVNFSEAGASLNPAAEQQLRQIAQRVGPSHDVRVNIIGHADARGPDDYNRKLGERRARAVADALVHAGFRPEQIEIASKGAAAPAVLGASQEAWASNRRAEIEIEAVPRSEPPRNERP